MFEGEDMRLVVEKNKECKIDYEFREYPLMSPKIKDLLVGMLRKEPSKRYTVEQLMEHGFFSEERKLFKS